MPSNRRPAARLDGAGKDNQGEMEERMMKKRWTIHFAAFLALALVLAGCSGKNESSGSGGSDEEQPKQAAIELKLHHHDPPNSIMGNFFTEWAQEIESKTDGRVKITIFPGSTLGAATDATNMLRNGIVDIAWGFIGLLPGEFPVSEVFSLPMLGIESTYAGSMALWDMYQNTDLLKNEYEGLKVLILHIHAPAPIGSKKEIQSAEDLKGMQIRAPGGPVTEFLKRLGASPLGMPPGEIYQSMQKGVIDGWMIDPMGVDAYKLPEVTPYLLDAKTYVFPFWIAMSENKWNALPDDVKAVFEEVSGETAIRKIADAIDTSIALVEEQMAANGGKITTLSEEEKARWAEVSRGVQEQWVKDTAAKGLPAQEAFDKMLELVQKYSG